MSDRNARRSSRASWPVRKLALGDEGPGAGRIAGSAAYLFGVAWQLSLEAWRLSGRELPSYERSEMPVKVIRRNR